MARKKRSIGIQEKQLQEVFHQMEKVSVMNTQTEAAVYARLSVEKESNETIQTQVEMLRQYIEAHPEFKLVDTYIDHGYSGTNFERPGFIKLMEDVRVGKIRCIIVKDLSRFGRNAIETGYYIETVFPRLNVRLIAVNDNFDSDCEMDRNSLVMPIKNMMNEMYAKDFSRKRVLAFEAESRKGEVKIARSIYGYVVDKEKNQLQPNPDTAPVVQMIFRWYLLGVRTGDIAKRLNTLGIMTPRTYKATYEMKSSIPETDRWTGERLKDILINEAYIGTTVYGKRKTAKYKNIPEHKTDPSEWIIHEKTHEAIISKDDFENVQKKWEEHSLYCKERNQKGRDYRDDIQDSFPSKIKCMECGNTMVYKRYTNHGQAHGIRKGFYYCVEPKNGGRYCNQQVGEDLIKITVLDQIHLMIKAMCDRKVLLNNMKEGKEEKGKLISLRVKIQNLQYRYRKADDASATLYENYSSGIINSQEFKELQEHYMTEKKKLRRELEIAQSQMVRTKQSIDLFLEIMNNLEKYIDEYSFNQILVDELVDQVEVSSKGIISVRMKCADVFQRIIEITED